MEKTGCILFDDKCGKKIWAEAVHTVYLKNTSPALGFHHQTRFELWMVENQTSAKSQASAT